MQKYKGCATLRATDKEDHTMTDSNTRIIKKYSNRKLYDTHLSAYITLEEMAQTIRGGNDVKVICNATKEDITYKTFIQLIHEQERKSVMSSDVDLLRRVICSKSGIFAGYICEVEGRFTREESKTESMVISEVPIIEDSTTDISNMALQ